MGDIDWKSRARAVADLARGLVLSTVEVAAPPERVYRALASSEVVDWWVRPGFFDTREWTGDVRAGGGWRAAGVGRGGPYVLEGEFVEVDPPRTLVHTWRLGGVPAPPTTVTCLLEPVEGGTRITLRQDGFTSPDVCAATAAGWETSFERLAELLASS
jgi:uncharacterized protein YndB with AHSA1/START domain